MVPIYQVSSQADLELIQRHRTMIGCDIKMLWNNYILQHLFLEISCVGIKLKVGDARLIIVPPPPPLSQRPCRCSFPTPAPESLITIV